jgi:hypothetical protein
MKQGKRMNCSGRSGGEREAVRVDVRARRSDRVDSGNFFSIPHCEVVNQHNALPPPPPLPKRAAAHANDVRLREMLASVGRSTEKNARHIGHLFIREVPLDTN